MHLRGKERRRHKRPLVFLPGFGQTLGASTVGVMLAMGLGLGPVPLFVAAAFAGLALLCSVMRLRTT
jgi:hypothetical protein